jgi:hypothetical protein
LPFVSIFNQVAQVSHVLLLLLRVRFSTTSSIVPFGDMQFHNLSRGVRWQTLRVQMRRKRDMHRYKAMRNYDSEKIKRGIIVIESSSQVRLCICACTCMRARMFLCGLFVHTCAYRHVSHKTSAMLPLVQCFCCTASLRRMSTVSGFLKMCA